MFYVKFCSKGVVSISGHKYGHASSLLISCLVRLHMPDMSTNSRPGPDLRGRRQGMPRAPQASLQIYQGKIYDRLGFQMSPGTALFGSVGRLYLHTISHEVHHNIREISHCTNSHMQREVLSKAMPQNFGLSRVVTQGGSL